MSKKTREEIVAAIADGKLFTAIKGNLKFTIDYKNGSYTVKTIDGTPMTEKDTNTIKFVSSLLKAYKPNNPGGNA